MEAFFSQFDQQERCLQRFVLFVILRILLDYFTVSSFWYALAILPQVFAWSTWHAPSQPVSVQWRHGDAPKGAGEARTFRPRDEWGRAVPHAVLLLPDVSGGAMLQLPAYERLSLMSTRSWLP